jgi:hypothetical protein
MKIDDAILRLPKWAQEHITDLRRERALAVEALRRFEREQKPGPIWVQDHQCFGESTGPTEVKRYIDAHSVMFSLGDNNVELGFELDGKLVLRTGGFHVLVIIPKVSNAVEIRLDK